MNLPMNLRFKLGTLRWRVLLLAIAVITIGGVVYFSGPIALKALEYRSKGISAVKSLRSRGLPVYPRIALVEHPIDAQIKSEIGSVRREQVAFGSADGFARVLDWYRVAAPSPPWQHHVTDLGGFGTGWEATRQHNDVRFTIEVRSVSSNASVVVIYTIDDSSCPAPTRD